MHARLPLVVVVLSCLGLVALAPSALAFGELPSSLPHPGFELPDGVTVDALPLKEQHTIVEVAGTVARVRLEQIWENTGTTPIEATYVFPTSTRAAVHDLRIQIGEQRELRAEIRAKAQAQAIFDAARDAGQTAGLLEQQRPNAVTMHLTNVMPGDRIRVFVEASELIRPTDGIYELVLPQTIGPRFAGNAGSEAFVENGFITDAKKAPTTTIDVTLRSPIGVRGIGSPTHAIAPRFASRDEGRVIITSSADDVVADRDVVLRWRLASDAVDTGVMLFRDRERGEHFFMLLGEAPPQVKAQTAPPRDVIFIVDVSGSMGGFPLETAKALVKDLTSELRPTDTFNMLFFAGGSAVLSPGGSLPATRANLDNALALLASRGGGGGTQLLQALTTAFALPRGDVDGVTRARTIVVATDGMISAERAAFSLVKEHLGDATLFAFGVHRNVNRHLIEGLAAAGRTEPFVVIDESLTQRAVDHFRTVAARPALTNIKVAFDGFAASDVEPAQPTDLYPGRPLVMLGHFTGPSSGRVVVTGTTADGPYRQVIPIEDNLETPDHAPLRQLWARERVARLADRDTPTDAQLAEVEALGLRYRLLTERTSFIVVDPAVRNSDGSLATVSQPSLRPKDMGGEANVLFGVSGYGLGVGGLGTSGTGAGGGGAVGQRVHSAQGAIGTRGMGAGGSGLGVGVGSGRDIGLSVTSKPSTARVAPNDSGARISGALDKALVQRIIQQHLGQIRYCYERQLSVAPGLQGALTITFTVGADGRVTAARIAKTTLRSEPVETCIQKRIMTWRFPTVAGGGTVTVSYPFRFQPG